MMTSRLTTDVSEAKTDTESTYDRPEVVSRRLETERHEDEPGRHFVVVWVMTPVTVLSC